MSEIIPIIKHPLFKTAAECYNSSQAVSHAVNKKPMSGRDRDLLARLEINNIDITAETIEYLCTAAALMGHGYSATILNHRLKLKKSSTIQLIDYLDIKNYAELRNKLNVVAITDGNESSIETASKVIGTNDNAYKKYLLQGLSDAEINTQISSFTIIELHQNINANHSATHNVEQTCAKGSPAYKWAKATSNLQSMINETKFKEFFGLCQETTTDLNLITLANEFQLQQDYHEQLAIQL